MTEGQGEHPLPEACGHCCYKAADQGTGYQVQTGTPWGCPRLAGLGQTLLWTLRQIEL